MSEYLSKGVSKCIWGKDGHLVIGFLLVGSECLCRIFGLGLIHANLFEWHMGVK